MDPDGDPITYSALYNGEPLEDSWLQQDGNNLTGTPPADSRSPPYANITIIANDG